MKKLLFILLSWIVFSGFNSIEIIHMAQTIMEAQHIKEVPKIIFVNSQDLLQVWYEANKYWIIDSSNEGNQIQIESILLEKYMCLLGLHNGKTGKVYVIYDLPECLKDAILLHEVIHFYQCKLNGLLYDSSIEVRYKHAMREFEAYYYQELFQKLFCK